MTEVSKDQFTSVAIAIRVDGKPSFMLLMTAAGDIKRMGFSTITNDEKTVAAGHDPSFFQRFIAAFPEESLKHAGTHEDPGYEGDRVVCRVELGGPEPVSFEMTYHALSASLPKAMASLVDLGEALTDEWYSGHLTASERSDSGSTAATGSAEVPPPATLPDAEPEDAEDPEEPEGDASDNNPEKSGPPLHPTASRKRFALAVVLDLFVLVAAYNLVLLVFARGGGGLPLGAALFFLVLVEFCLLQFVRRSPGYWLLGMAATIGEFPRVDPARLAGESLVTHIVAVILLRSGIDAMTAWAAYQDPIPYFGISRVGVFSVLLSFLMGGAFIAAAVLIFRNDLRGVWVGAGVTAFSFLSVWFARGPEFNGWLRLELMAQRAAEGRPVEARALDGVLEMVIPVLLGVMLLYAVGMYFAWRKLRPSPAAEVAPVA